MAALDEGRLIAELGARVKLIGNPSVRIFVQRMLSRTPNAFYTLPASYRHHLYDERRKHGNLLHTLRVVDIVLLIADACNASQGARDILTAGAILHDVCRRGIFGETRQSRKDHPQLVRKLAEYNGLTCDYYNEIMGIVENHMGRWGEPPHYTHIGLDEALHLADCIEAHLLEVGPKTEGHVKLEAPVVERSSA